MQYEVLIDVMMQTVLSVQVDAPSEEHAEQIVEETHLPTVMRYADIQIEVPKNRRHRKLLAGVKYYVPGTFSAWGVEGLRPGEVRHLHPVHKPILMKEDGSVSVNQPEARQAA